MQRRIERLVSGQAKKLASAAHPFSFLLYSTNKQLQVDSKHVDLQVGKQVWFNVPRRMRQELWLSVLHKHRGAGAVAARQFATFVKQSLPEVVDADIEKDVGRTFPNSARFASAAGKLSLQRVLRAYAVYDTEVGYCQGMNFLAGLLLTYMPNEACAFGGLVVLMQERQLRELYRTDLAQLQLYLWQFGSLLPAKLKQHLDEQGTLPVLYVSSWLLTCFGSEYPLFFSCRVLDVVLTGSYPHAMIKVALALLQHCEKQLLPMTDMEDIVHFLKAEVPCWSREVLQDILSDALSQPWSAEQEAVLGNDEGMESVVDAVGRVNSLPRSGSRTPTKASSALSTCESPASTAAAAAQVLSTPQRTISKASSYSIKSDSNNSPAGPNPLPPRGPALAPVSSDGHAWGSSRSNGPALVSTKSASWAARLHASPSTAAVHSARRHTTEEEAHGLQDSGPLPARVVISLPGSVSSSRRESEDGAAAAAAAALTLPVAVSTGPLQGLAVHLDSPVADLLGLDNQGEGEEDEWGDVVGPDQEAGEAAEQAGRQEPGTSQASGHEQSGAEDLLHGVSLSQAAGNLVQSSSSSQAAPGSPVQLQDTGLSDDHGWADRAQWQDAADAPKDHMPKDYLHRLSMLFLDEHSAPSLRAHFSTLSTTSDIQQLDVWPDHDANVLKSSSNAQQLEGLWHEDDDFGGFESATASSHSPGSVSSVLAMSQRLSKHVQQMLHGSEQDLHTEKAPQQHEADNDMERWGSYVLPDSVTAQVKSEDSVSVVDASRSLVSGCPQMPQTPMFEPNCPGSQSSPSVSVLSAVHSVSSLDADHITDKQQKQLELFMQSVVGATETGW